MKKKIVCLGGGIGTVNLIKGLKAYDMSIAVIVSMADEGGSSGRLRRLYNVLPPGDLVSCMAALCINPNDIMAKLLTYRFPGDRYAKDTELAGHKMGNLLFVALRDITGSSEKAIETFQTLFSIPGTFLPATLMPVSISAKTVEGKIVYGEETIDLGKYAGKRVLEEIYLDPKDAATTEGVLQWLTDADVIIAGPGDLYTTILPVLIIPEIAKKLKESTAKKIFIVNVANKPFETKGYRVTDFVAAVKKHLGCFPFTTIIANNNYEQKIPKKYHYSYVKNDPAFSDPAIRVVLDDLVDDTFPLYHSSKKLAKIVSEHI